MARHVEKNKHILLSDFAFEAMINKVFIVSDVLKFQIQTQYIYLYWTIILISISLSCSGQEVEHNYLVGPQYTTCDSLQDEFNNEEEALFLVENATYRSTSQFKINRAKGVRGAWYYSCDNKTGFLILLIDNNKHLFQYVSNKIWEQLTQTTDYKSFIMNNLKPYKVQYPGD